ncbi:MAG: SpaH/EbpB family LPXTG-anchored major pilin [Clostridia bacterium]|nr:SpaH/EbpB family LPXTG-anchored major pilin [Clostridia bacterium]
MKKLALILMSVVLVFTCTVMAFAEPSEYVITVNNAVSGEQYTAYKVFDVTYGSMPDGASSSQTTTAYSYSIVEGSEWWDTVTTRADGAPVDKTGASFQVDFLTFTKTTKQVGGHYVYTVTYNEESFNVKDFAEKLYGAVNGKTAAAQATATGSTVDLDVGESGYFFVTTSTGALCALDTNHPTADVNEKNSVPTVQKKVAKDVTNPDWQDATNQSIGKDVAFKITVTDGAGTDAAITLTDTMTPGLTLKQISAGVYDIKVYEGGTTTEIPATQTVNEQTVTNYTITVTDPQHFTIVFSDAYVKSLADNASIDVKYTATLNENAYIKGNGLDNSGETPADLLNMNTVVMNYSNQTSQDSVTVETYQFEIIKTTSNNYGKKILNGAKFRLYDAATGGSEVPVVFVRDEVLQAADTTNGTPAVVRKIYRRALAGEAGMDIDAGIALIEGEGNGAYYLEETQAPDGYNKLSSRQAVTINGNNIMAELSADFSTYVDGGIRIENKTGAEMPSTGGIGTIIFTVIGSLLVIGAVVVLVSKKRMHAYED